MNWARRPATRGKRSSVRIARAAAAVLGLALLAGCGGAVASVRQAECGAYGTLPVPPEMLYPMANATGVPDGNFTLVLSSTYGDGVYLSGGSGANIALATTTVPSPMPSPSATAPPSSTPAGYAVGALAAHTTYTVDATFTQPAGCPNISGTVGAFTTQ